MGWCHKCTLGGWNHHTFLVSHPPEPTLHCAHSDDFGVNENASSPCDKLAGIPLACFFSFFFLGHSEVTTLTRRQCAVYKMPVGMIQNAIGSVRLLSCPPTRTHPVPCQDARTQVEVSFSPGAIGSARWLGCYRDCHFRLIFFAKIFFSFFFSPRLFCQEVNALHQQGHR